MNNFFYRFTGRRQTSLSIVPSLLQIHLKSFKTCRRIAFIPTSVNPLSVSGDKAKKRLILDLGYVSLHVWKDGVKFEVWKVFSTV